MQDKPTFKPLLLIGLLAVAALLGVGGYFMYREHKCEALEDDYLDSVDSLRQLALLGTILPGADDRWKERKQLEDLQLRLIEMRLTSIYRECGDRAGRDAARRASQLMLGN